jgi:hypothetical protein
VQEGVRVVIDEEFDVAEAVPQVRAGGPAGRRGCPGVVAVVGVGRADAVDGRAGQPVGPVPTGAFVAGRERVAGRAVGEGAAV